MKSKNLTTEWKDVSVIDVRDVSFLIMVRGKEAGEKVHDQLISKCAETRHQFRIQKAANDSHVSTPVKLLCPARPKH